MQYIFLTVAEEKTINTLINKHRNLFNNILQIAGHI